MRFRNAPISIPFHCPHLVIPFHSTILPHHEQLEIRIQLRKLFSHSFVLKFIPTRMHYFKIMPQTQKQSPVKSPISLLAWKPPSGVGEIIKEKLGHSLVHLFHKSLYLHVAHLTDDKSAKHLAKTVEHEGIRDIQILVTDPVLLRYYRLLVVSVVVFVAMNTSCGGGERNVSTFRREVKSL